jgi:hypothetical protein
MTEFLKKISKSDIRNILAILSVVGFFIVIILLILKPVPVDNKDVVNVIIGFLGAGLIGGVAGYYFGASKGESTPNKDE